LNGALAAGWQVRDAERLLVLLTLNNGKMVLRQTLASTLWPQTGSLVSLRQSVNYLRSLLGEHAIRLETSKTGVLLNLDGADVDVLAFDAAVRSNDVEQLKHALALYVAPLLANWEERHPEDQNWLVRAREKRRELRRDMLKRLAQGLIASGEHAESAGYLQQYVSANPAEEWGWRALMQALSDSGERIAALNTYAKCRELFHQRYQLSPPAEMTRLYHQIQQGVGLPTLTLPDDEARLEPVGGAVPLDSPYYVVRPTDGALQAAIARRDGLVLLKGPRQTGKTSLLARGLQQARLAGTAVAVTDFQRISSQHWACPNRFLMALGRSIAEQLELDRAPEDTWNDGEGPNENFERFLKREVLRKVSAPIVWGLDEVDRLFSCPFSSDVFGLFRSWYNDRALNPASPWHRLTLAIVYATEAHLFISDLNQSPFNVGTRLTLEDFTPDQVIDLNNRYAAPLKDQGEIAHFIDLVGGNPYLVRRGIVEISAKSLSLDAFGAQADRDDGCYGDHLHRLMQSIMRDSNMSCAVQELLQDKPCPSLETFYRLRSAGVISGTDLATARFRCRIYRSYLGGRIK